MKLGRAPTTWSTQRDIGAEASTQPLTERPYTFFATRAAPLPMSPLNLSKEQMT